MGGNELRRGTSISDSNQESRRARPDAQRARFGGSSGIVRMRCLGTANSQQSCSSTSSEKTSHRQLPTQDPSQLDKLRVPLSLLNNHHPRRLGAIVIFFLNGDANLKLVHDPTPGVRRAVLAAPAGPFALMPAVTRVPLRVRRLPDDQVRWEGNRPRKRPWPGLGRFRRQLEEGRRRRAASGGDRARRRRIVLEEDGRLNGRPRASLGVDASRE